MLHWSHCFFVSSVHTPSGQSGFIITRFLFSSKRIDCCGFGSCDSLWILSWTNSENLSPQLTKGHTKSLLGSVWTWDVLLWLSNLYWRLNERSHSSHLKLFLWWSKFWCKLSSFNESNEKWHWGHWYSLISSFTLIPSPKAIAKAFGVSKLGVHWWTFHVNLWNSIFC